MPETKTAPQSAGPGKPVMVSGYFTAEIPKRNLSVSLSANVLERLRREVARAVTPNASGGLLLGNRSDAEIASLVVADCFPIASGTSSTSQEPGEEFKKSKLLKQALGLWKPGSHTALYAVGQYRIACGPAAENETAISAEDLSHNDLFLRLTLQDSGISAAFFVIDRQLTPTTRPDLTLPFDKLALAPASPALPAHSQDRASSSPQPRGDSDQDLRITVGTGWSRAILASIIAFLLLSTSGLLLVKYRAAKLLDKRGRTDTAELHLKPVRTGSQWELRWNQNAAAVRNANHAKLSIVDGARHNQIDLDAQEIKHGHVMYSPETEDVTFRLELYDQSGRVITESTRALASIPADQSDDSGVHHSQSRPAAKQVHNTNRSTGVPTPSSKHSTDSASELASAPHVGAHEEAHDKDGRTSSAAKREPTHTTNSGQLLLHPAPSVTGPVERRRDTPSPNLLARNLESSSPGSAPASREISSVAAKARPSPPMFVPPQPVQKLPPKFTQVGIMSSSVTDVTVLVHIDPNGRVATARLGRNSGNVSRPLALAALDAAKQWTFQPAQLHGNNVESDYTIVFRFVPPSR